MQKCIWTDMLCVPVVRIRQIAPQESLQILLTSGPSKSAGLGLDWQTEEELEVLKSQLSWALRTMGCSFGWRHCLLSMSLTQMAQEYTLNLSDMLYALVGED